jgi:RAB protein geranylgeranyltransferase component A
MKDSKAKSKEWWEVVEEYFTKEFENNMVKHRADERIMTYKLEAYQNIFPIFICGSRTTIEVLGQDEETKVGPNGTTQEEEIKTEEVQTEESQDLKGGVVKKKIKKEFRNTKRWRLF